MLTLADFLLLYSLYSAPTQRQLLARISVEVASALELLSLTQDQAFQQQVLQETKTLLITYLQPYFPEGG